MYQKDTELSLRICLQICKWKISRTTLCVDEHISQPGIFNDVKGNYCKLRHAYSILRCMTSCWENTTSGSFPRTSQSSGRTTVSGHTSPRYYSAFLPLASGESGCWVTSLLAHSIKEYLRVLPSLSPRSPWSWWPSNTRNRRVLSRVPRSRGWTVTSTQGFHALITRLRQAHSTSFEVYSFERNELLTHSRREGFLLRRAL